MINTKMKTYASLEQSFNAEKVLEKERIEVRSFINSKIVGKGSIVYLKGQNERSKTKLKTNWMLSSIKNQLI